MRLRVSAYAVVERDGQVLLAHLTQRPGWNLPDSWTLPGGGLEPGEHPEEAAVREVAEETGLAVRLTGLLGIDSLVADGEDGPRQALRILYRGEVIGGELRVEADGSTDDVAWHRLADVPGLSSVELVTTALAMAGLGGAPRLS